MPLKGVQYHFTTNTWQHDAPGGWFFVSIPKEISNEIRTMFKNEEEGWGRLKATAQIGKTEWKTAIWFDSKSNVYLLPLKAEIRKKEGISIDQEVAARIWI
ncbi:DUF1905 domain-containing protein [Spongiivirga citrea]|uniref:DUF1905 domain-containing protein n=2 Tax=Spongiivirga citrea TaxID=1481457 RepID=A0A6M0CS78_9FLAO|nr:DUF1905 domain-containing protein [Spongiivirga citrea]